MDRILVAYGARHGRTGEIALAIGEQLTRAGRGVDVRPCARAHPAADYAAVVVVGAVQSHGWEPGTWQYLQACGGLPTSVTRLVAWQPGPSTDPTADPALDAWCERSGHPPPVRFRAPLSGWDPSDLGALWPARPPGDDRQRWGEIRRWAHTLAFELADQLIPAA